MTTYIGGLASGLDTASMINQLMAVERAPIARLEASRNRFQATDNVWTDVSTRLSSLRSSLEKLTDGAGLDGFLRITSSDPNVAKGAITGPGEPQTVSFKVDRLAARHELVSAGDYASSDSLIGVGTFTVVVDGVEHDILTDPDTTLADLASEVNALDLGVTASLLNVSQSAVKLRLIADQVGADSVFSVSSDLNGVDSTVVVRSGVDAQITMGSLTITNPGNRIVDIVPGLSVDLIAASDNEVTITLERDADAIVESVTAVVGQMNSAMTRLRDLMSYNSASGAAGILLGDGTARRILFDLQSSISSVIVDGANVSHLGAIGIETRRDGTIGFDQERLRSALETDLDGVARLLTRWGSASGTDAVYVKSGSDTAEGTYPVVVTQAATTAWVRGAVYASPGSDVVFEVTSGSRIAEILIPAGSSANDAVNAINSSLAAAGIETVSASLDTDAIRLAETRYGSGPGFSIADSGALGLDGAYHGTDVVGTIGGETATGLGRLLTAGSGAPDGLAVEVLTTPQDVLGAGGTLSVGDVTVGGGLVGAIERILEAAGGPDGSIALARSHTQAQIERVNNSIDRFEDRLLSVEDMLIRRFSVMEQLLAQLSSQQSWLQSQLAGLNSPK